MTESDDSDSGGESSGISISRRQALFGAGGVGAAVLGGTGLYTTLTDASNERTYIAQQGKLRWEATSLSYKDKTIEEFYNYQQASGNANPLVDISSEPNASRMFIYEGPVGTSLVFLHGSPKAESGGTAFFNFSGNSFQRAQLFEE